MTSLHHYIIYRLLFDRLRRCAKNIYVHVYTSLGGSKSLYVDDAKVFLSVYVHDIRRAFKKFVRHDVQKIFTDTCTLSLLGLEKFACVERCKSFPLGMCS